jgi:hypothetical protein
MLAVFRGMFLGSAQWFVSDGQRRGAAMEARAVMWVGRKGGRRADAADPGCGCCSEENPGGRPGRKSSEERTVTDRVVLAERCRWARRLTLALELALTWRGRNLLVERRRRETSSREISVWATDDETGGLVRTRCNLRPKE